MPKRLRVNYESQESLRLSQPTNTSIVRSQTQSDGKDKFLLTSVTKHATRPTRFTFSELSRILFPPYQIRRLWYGNKLSAFGSAGFSISQNAKASDITSAQQGHDTYIHMPATLTAAQGANTYSLETLITKAKDIMNYSFKNDSGGLSGTGKNDQTINYFGGKVRHTFTNTSNATLTFEFTISTPRQFLTWQSANSTVAANLGDNLPVQCALQDFADNVPLQNLLTPQYATTAIDSSTDPMFNFSQSCRTLHYRWKVNKPNFVRLEPGQTVDYIVNIPAFKFSDSDWNTYITRTADAAFLPEFLPFCTVILDVRVKSELCHNADYSLVQTADGKYTHVQQEYHNVQACPYVKLNNIVTINSLDAAIAPGSQKFINEETDAIDTYIE